MNIEWKIKQLSRDDIEVGGFVYFGEEGEPEVMEAENVSRTPETHFEYKAEDYLMAKNMGAFAFFHTHPDTYEVPKEYEQKLANIMCMNSIIYTPNIDKFDYIAPQTKIWPLKDRKFFYGIFDCWTLVRDAYRYYHDIEMTNYKAPWGWWRSGGNYFEDNVTREGFAEVASPQDGDVVFMQNDGFRVINHIGYFKSGQVLHHYSHQLSRWEPVGRLERDVRKFYRHHTF